MKKIQPGGFLVFLLFLALGCWMLFRFYWLRVIFWLALGLVFLIADNFKKIERK